MTPGPGAEEAISFTTSGRSGEPATWVRTRRQLLDEVDLLRARVVGEVEQVVNFAPPEHLYGRLLGSILPHRAGIPVHQRWHLPLSAPDLGIGLKTLLVCLPSTWVLLRHLVPRLRELPGIVAVHSTGPPVPATFQVAEAMSGSRFRLVELFGSTETGAVAHREHRGGDAPPWELFDDVTAVFDGPGEQRLRIRGPRLAREPGTDRPPDEFTLDDLVRPLGDRRFERVGRASGLIKINGRRYQLERFEAVLRERFPGGDFACLPVADDVRAEHFELYYTDRSGAIGPADIQRCFAEHLPGVPVPRGLHRVARIPESPTGKVRSTLLTNKYGSLDNA